MKPYEAASGGIARTFQNVALFKGMTTLDNIMTGRTLKMNSSFFWQIFRHGPAMAEEIEHRRKVEEIIDFLEIEHIRKVPVGKLPYGLQKRVELGRALAMEPDLLLLDEPMAGMNLEEKEDMCRFILDVNRQYGTTIALIEHDMGVVMDLSDRVVVLEYGRKIADGTPDVVKPTRRSSTPILAWRTEELPCRQPKPPPPRPPSPAGSCPSPRRLAPWPPPRPSSRCWSSPAHAPAGSLFYKIIAGPFVEMWELPDLLVQTLWEGAVAGVLYALIALGFVLIFKASGVFNFAQGIMVVFAGLTLVGTYELLGRTINLTGMPAAYIALFVTLGVMALLAMAVERVVLRPLVNQPDIILFMATFGLTYLLIGLGESIFGGNPKIMIAEPARPAARRDRPEHPRWPRDAAEDRHRGRRDRDADDHRPRGLLPEDAHRPRAARGGRQPQGGPLRRHLAEPDLGDRLVRGRRRRAGHRHHVGRALRRLLRAADDRAEGPARAHPRRLHLGARRHRRRAHHRHRREDRRVLLGSAARRRHRELARLRHRARLPVFRPQGLFGEKIIERI